MQRLAIATTWPESISRTSGSPLLATPRWSVARGPLPQWDACSRPRYSGAHSPGAGASSGTNYSTGRHREAHGVSLRRRRGSGGQLRPAPRSPAGSRPRSTSLDLPVHGMRLHIHHGVGSGDGLCGSHYRSKETITVTPAEIIYQRRIAVLDHAARTGNVAETCRIFGISRTRYYQWKNVADRYGLDALVPKGRRMPQMPEATPTHVVQSLLTLAVVEPTIGCRQYADRLGDQGFSIAKSTVQKHLVAHGLGKRSQRLARAAAITAATTGLLTDAARD